MLQGTAMLLIYPISVSSLDVHDVHRCLLTLLFVMQSILNCAEKNEGFYVKCGFKRSEVEMTHYY